MSQGARVESQRWAMNAVGVEQQSPGSRSAPWVDDRSEVQTPNGVLPGSEHGHRVVDTAAIV